RSDMLPWSREHSMVIAALLRRLGEILVQERLTTPDVVEQALARAKATGERVGEALVAVGAVKSEDVLRALAEQQSLAYLSRDEAFEAPVVRLVNLLVENAIDAEASDIHVEPFEDTLRVRYRLDGILFDQEAPPRRLQAAVTSRIKLMAEMNIAERRLPQDGRIRVTVRGRRVDIRVSTIPTVHGESIVMRLLDRSSVFLPLEKLGFASAMLRRFEALIKRPHGILLVTGPAAPGKTTTP